MNMKDSVLKIEPIKPLEEGEFMVGYNTKISLGGREISGVEAIDVHYRPGDVVRAEVNLLGVQHTTDGLKCLFMMRHPEDDCWMEVSKIELEDGEVIEFTKS